MNISLTRELEALVKRRVRSGRYGSASEVVRDALRLLDERDRMRDLRFRELRREVASLGANRQRRAKRAEPSPSAGGRGPQPRR